MAIWDDMGAIVPNELKVAWNDLTSKQSIEQVVHGAVIGLTNSVQTQVQATFGQTDAAKKLAKGIVKSQIPDWVKNPMVWVIGVLGVVLVYMLFRRR